MVMRVLVVEAPVEVLVLVVVGTKAGGLKPLECYAATGWGPRFFFFGGLLCFIFFVGGTVKINLTTIGVMAHQVQLPSG